MPPNHAKHQPPKNYKADNHLFPHLLQKIEDGASRRCGVAQLRAHHVPALPGAQSATRWSGSRPIRNVTFKLEVCYAGTGEPVDPAGLINKPVNLPTLPDRPLAVPMNGGKVGWHLVRASRSTKPIGRLFIFQVTCTLRRSQVGARPSCSPPFQVIWGPHANKEAKKRAASNAE